MSAMIRVRDLASGAVTERTTRMASEMVCTYPTRYALVGRAYEPPAAGARPVDENAKKEPDDALSPERS